MAHDPDSGCETVPDRTVGESPLGPGADAGEARTTRADDRVTDGETAAPDTRQETASFDLDGPGDTLPPPVPGGARPPLFLGDYELLDEVARGGMGIVYRARQAHLGRVVALKLVRDPTLASYSEIRRFRAEAEAVAQLDHPNIVPIYQVGQTEDQPYFSMKLIEGGNLSRHVARLKEDPRAAAAMMVKVARAVHYAHQRAILHRDLKPSNILLDEQDEPYVTDFGLAKRIEPGGASAQTVTGAVMGTPAYMPPEQARGGTKTLTTAADIYSLGATLYETLTGRAPFVADSILEVLNQVKDREPARPRALNPALDRDLETICLKCLEKEPSRRYSSAEALAVDLEDWRAGRPIKARPVGMAERLTKWARRRPEIAALAAAVLVAVVAGMAGVFWQWLAAERNLASLKRSLYDADMKLGEQALANSQYQRVEALVRAHEPSRPRGPDDLRGFEWHYLRAVADPEPMILQAHARSVEDLKFSPDGTLLATLGVDRIIRLWDVATGRLVRELDSHGGNYVRCLAFHPGGTWLASGGYDRVVWLWEVATGRLVRTYPLSTPIRGLAFSFDGRRLAVGCDDPRAVVLDVETREVVMRSELPRTSRGPVEGNIPLVFNHAGTRLIVFNYAESTGQRDQSWLLDTATGQVVRPLKGGMGVFSADDRTIFQYTLLGGWRVCDAETGAVLNQSEASFRERMHTPGLQEGYQSPVLDSRSRFLFVATGTGTDVYDIEARRTLRTLPMARPNTISSESCLALSPDDRVLAINGGLGKVVVWYNLLGRKTSTIPAGTARLTGLALDPAGRVVAAGGYDGVVTLADLPGRRVLRRLTGPGFDLRLMSWGDSTGVPTSGSYLVIVGTDNNNLLHIRIFDAAGNRVTDTDETKLSAAKAAAIATLKQQLLGLLPPHVLTDTEKAQVIREATSIVGQTPGPEGPVYGVAFGTDGHQVAAAGADGRVYLWDAADGRPVHTFTAGRGQALAVAFDPSGRRLAAGGDDRKIRVWDAATGAVVLEVPEAQEGPIHGLSYSPDGRTLASSGGDQTVQLRDAGTGRSLRTLRRDPGTDAAGPFFNAAFSPDGRRVVAACAGGIAVVWDARRGTVQLTLTGHVGPVHHAAFSPDGRRVVTAGADGAVKLWDAVLGTETFELRHVGPLSAAALTRDGLQLVAAGWDGSLQFWDARPIVRIPGRGAVPNGK